jgi:hypothetical protein
LRDCDCLAVCVLHRGPFCPRNRAHHREGPENALLQRPFVCLSAAMMFCLRLCRLHERMRFVEVCDDGGVMLGRPLLAVVALAAWQRLCALGWVILISDHGADGRGFLIASAMTWTIWASHDCDYASSILAAHLGDSLSSHGPQSRLAHRHPTGSRPRHQHLGHLRSQKCEWTPPQSHETPPCD